MSQGGMLPYGVEQKTTESFKHDLNSFHIFYKMLIGKFRKVR